MSEQVDLGELAQGALIRVTRVAHLPTAAPDGLLDADYDVREFIGAAAYALWGIDSDDPDELYDAILDTLDDFHGWVIEAQTPHTYHFSEDGRSFGFSWGVAWCEFFYGVTYEEAIEAACRWAEAQHEQDRQKEAASA